MDSLRITRAILSVTDKSGLENFARFLSERGVELVSTGGTKKKLAETGLPVTGVSEVTGFPEILGGRVKTLHPHVHGGVLADKDEPSHMATLAEMKIKPFDLVCVNLYDFASAKAAQATLRAAVEQIDIGGPCMLRAAAKNFHSVLVCPDPAYYPAIMAELTASKDFSIGLETRRKLAAETFRRTSSYDAMIASYLDS